MEQSGDLINGPAGFPDHTDDLRVFQSGDLLPEFLVAGLELLNFCFIFLQLRPELMNFGVRG